MAPDWTESRMTIFEWQFENFEKYFPETCSKMLIWITGALLMHCLRIICGLDGFAYLEHLRIWDKEPARATGYCIFQRNRYFEKQIIECFWNCSLLFQRRICSVYFQEKVSPNDHFLNKVLKCSLVLETCSCYKNFVIFKNKSVAFFWIF